MGFELLTGAVTAFLGCTDEHQLNDAVELVRDGATVILIPGPHQYILLDEEMDVSDTPIWHFATEMAAAFPDLVVVREPPTPNEGQRGWWFGYGRDYLNWALAGLDHVDLLSLGVEISRQSLTSPDWPLELWLEWLESHGGGSLTTYDRPDDNDAPVWLQLRSLLQSRTWATVNVGVARAAGPRTLEWPANWLAFDPWLEPVDPYDGPPLDDPPNPLAVLRGRYGRYALDPATSVPDAVAERLSSGHDVLAEQVWRPVDGFHFVAELFGMGDEDQLARPEAARADLHHRRSVDGCFLLPGDADVGFAPEDAPADPATFVVMIVSPGSRTYLTVHTACDSAGHTIAVRIGAPYSHFGSRWPWRRLGTVEIPSGRCALWYPWQDHLYSDVTEILDVVPGRYAFEMQTPGAWRIRIEKELPPR